MRSMDVMRPGESTSLGVITSQCFIFALFKTHRDRFLGHACPCRAASASCRRHARVGPGPAAEPAVKVGNTAAARRQRIRSLLNVRKAARHVSTH